MQLSQAQTVQTDKRNRRENQVNTCQKHLKMAQRHSTPSARGSPRHPFSPQPRRTGPTRSLRCSDPSTHISIRASAFHFCQRYFSLGPPCSQHEELEEALAETHGLTAPLYQLDTRSGRKFINVCPHTLRNFLPQNNFSQIGLHSLSLSFSRTSSFALRCIVSCNPFAARHTFCLSRAVQGWT